MSGHHLRSYCSNPHSQPRLFKYIIWCHRGYVSYNRKPAFKLGRGMRTEAGSEYNERWCVAWPKWILIIPRAPTLQMWNRTTWFGSRDWCKCVPKSQFWYGIFLHVVYIPSKEARIIKTNDNCITAHCRLTDLMENSIGSIFVLPSFASFFLTRQYLPALNCGSVPNSKNQKAPG